MYTSAYTRPYTAFTPPRPDQRTVSIGDRIFVRLTMTTGESLEFVLTTASSLSEVIGEVRNRGRHLRGLGTVSIRNASCGWATERPLRLYGSSWTPASAPGHSGTYRLTSTPRTRVRNLGPWDTH